MGYLLFVVVSRNVRDLRTLDYADGNAMECSEGSAAFQADAHGIPSFARGSGKTLANV